jgi:hypothetical protein
MMLDPSRARPLDTDARRRLIGDRVRQRDQSDTDSPEPTTLRGDPQARWDELADTARQMATAAVGDDDGFRAAWDAMTQASRGLDRNQALNSIHVPTDAGEHAEALAAMLRRIPDGWGRWISCDRGWYSLIVELDEQLRALLPNYVIHQVKEKYGGLRYYWEAGEQSMIPTTGSRRHRDGMGVKRHGSNGAATTRRGPIALISTCKHPRASDGPRPSSAASLSPRSW